MPSYTQYKWQLSVLDSSDEDITWITVKGNHIPIKKGQTAEQATKAFFERKRAETNKAKHEKAHADIKQKYDDLKAVVAENQKKFDELFKDYESYQKDPALKQLAFENNLRHQALSKLQREMLREEQFIKRYQKALNQLDNNENKIEAPDVAKVVSFGKIPPAMAKEAVENMRGLLKKYPFMKGHFDYIGSQDSKEFKDWYKESVIESVIEERKHTILGNIRFAEDYVKQPKDDKDPFYAQRLATAQAIVDKVKELGEEGYARYWVETHFRTTQRFSSRVWATYTARNHQAKHGAIVFNSQNYEEHGKTSADSEFHPVGCNTTKSVLDHEFGHSVYFQLQLNKPFKYAAGTPLRELQDFINREFTLHGKTYITKNLSAYAATNVSEFFAEAFAEYENNPNPRHIAKTVGEYLEQYKKDLADGKEPEIDKEYKSIYMRGDK